MCMGWDQKMKRQIRKGLKTFLKICILTISLIAIGFVIYENTEFWFIRKLEVLDYNKMAVFNTVEIEPREKVEIKALIDDTFNFHYLYFEKDYSHQDVNGRAIPQFAMVFVDKGLEGYDYAVRLAHEISHCRFYADNECYVEYHAIITLIESKYEWLSNVGKVWANEVITYHKTEYDCGYYLLQYFNERM